MPTVLIVEDEDHIRQFVALNLKVRGYTVIPVETAEAGLQQLRASLPGAIVLDVRLPGMSGWNMLECIANDPTLPTIPVIIMTASRVLGSPDEFPYERIVERLEKPVSVDRLLRAVRQALG